MKSSDINRADRTWETPDFPGTVLVDNISACNLRCSICDHRNVRRYRPVQSMDRALHDRIIDEIASENPSARVWEVFFGDPFLLKDISSRIRYAKDKGLSDVVLNTNGQLMDQKRAMAVIKAGLDAIYVGIDAARADTYSGIRVGGDFETAVKNVLGYRDLLAGHGSPHQKLFVQFVVLDSNAAEVDEFRAFWNREGVNVKIRPKVSWAGLVDAENLTGNDLLIRKPCYFLMQTMNICADGRVALCSVDVHCRVECGNLNEASMKDIWRNGPLAEYRRMHREGRFDDLPDMCRQCRDWQSAYADYSYA